MKRKEEFEVIRRYRFSCCVLELIMFFNVITPVYLTYKSIMSYHDNEIVKCVVYAIVAAILFSLLVIMIFFYIRNEIKENNKAAKEIEALGASDDPKYQNQAYVEYDDEFDENKD